MHSVVCGISPICNMNVSGFFVVDMLQLSSLPHLINVFLFPNTNRNIKLNVYY